MANLRWYASRLRSMSVGELGWRLGRSVAGQLEQLRSDGTDWSLAFPDFARDDALARLRDSEGRPVLLDRARAGRIAARQPALATALLEAADRAASMRFGYFGYAEVELPKPVDWHFDPLANVSWDASPKIDYRAANADVKWIWELNRLQHLPWLAQAWLITGAVGYGTAAFEQLDSWIEQNPPGIGIGWRNPFEPGVRAISVALALQGFRDHPELTAERFGRIMAMLAASAHRCYVDRSRYSSANNHLIGEMAGLAVVAMLFPELPGAQKWERRALAVLEEEAARQLLPDGAGAEQAVGYQMFTVELMLVVGALLLERDGRLPQAIRAAVDRSAAYLSALVGESDPAPRYGDDDEGFALRLDPTPMRTVRDHLGLVAALTGSPAALRHGAATWSSEWFGQLCDLERSSAEQPVCTTLKSVGANHYAPDGGLVVLRRGARRVLMDVAPLGFLSIAAHGHADALSVAISLDGHDVIGDPGAASYYGHPDWRRVHRGTRVHGTVEVDRCDQSVVGGPFMWGQHARVRVLAVDLEAGVVDAEHYGYRRLAEAVTHRRWLIANLDGDAVLVVDLVSGAGRHEVRTSWPLEPSLDVVRAAIGHVASRDGSPVIHIAAAATGQLVDEQIRGDEHRGLGWWSNRLESREPAWLVGSSGVGELPLAVATVIQPAAGGRGVCDLTISHGAGFLDVSWSDTRQHHRALIDTTRFGSVSVEPLTTSA